ncbi:MAG: deoxyribose-phosphate aldolase [Phycisphaerales bacterium]
MSTRPAIPPRTTVDRVMAEARAASFTTRSIKAGSKEHALRLAISMVDLTTLEGADTPERVRRLCRKAVRPDPRDLTVGPVGAVCVYPELVPMAVECTRGSGVNIAAVATGFPSGQYPLEVRLEDTRRAIRAGASEIDMVINRGAFLRGDYATVMSEIAAVKQTCTEEAGDRVHLKVILETGELGSLDAVRFASDLAMHSGLTEHDFIKTSTGKVNPAATMPVTLVMLEAIRDHHHRTGIRIGMKPAGGIRQAKQAWHYLVMVKETLGEDWLTPALFRFGASSLLDDLLRQLWRLRTGNYPAAHDFAMG